MAKRLGVDTRVSRKVLEIGAMAARLGRYSEAERIISAVKAFRDDVPLPGTALALAFLFQNRLAEAADELETVLSAFPNHQLGKALLGLVYRDMGHRGWQRVLQEVIDDDRDEWAMELAKNTIHDHRSPAVESYDGGDQRLPPNPGMYA